MNINNLSNMKYYITYEKDERGGYIAAAPAIQGCTVYGKTLSLAHRNIQSAIQECLEVQREFINKIPKESLTPAQVKRLSFVHLPDYV